MKKKRFQWLSNLRKFVMNNVCWKIRKKNQRKQEIIESEVNVGLHLHERNRDFLQRRSTTQPVRKILPEAPIFSQQITRLYPDISIQKSSCSDLGSRDHLCKDIFSLEDDTSLLILLTEETMRQHPFPMVRQKTLPVIPLPWITKITDIREGNRVELQAGLPTATIYEDLERSWITWRIFESAWGSYPYLITQMQVVPYIRKRSPFYFHLIFGQRFGEHDPLTRPGKLESTNDQPKGDVQSQDFGNYLKDAQIRETIADIHISTGQSNSEHPISKLPSTDTLKINWSGIDINIQELHLTSLLAEDGDYKKLYKGYYGDIHFIAADYRRIPKKLEMNVLARLRSPDLIE
ncbi:hypothetical protein CHS0354_006647 [Potamilus streckersoni]|uniref:Uncharacterized protein n=1 Tax=Potamilus streckersoni TaxID=2493646 RepID=A0AAE0W2C4_9BIVA|nr:hypothetical protein CHS0354_006647 [Potamilus streckersoni]